MAKSVAPPEHARAVTVYVVALLDLLSAQLAGLRASEFHVMRCTQPFHDGIEALRGPLKLWPKTMDGHPIAAVASPVVGGSELSTQGVRGYQPGQLFLVVEPVAQRFADGSVAGGWDPSRGCTPIEQAIEASDEGIGQADTHNPRVILRFSGHDFPSGNAKHYMM